MTRAIAIAFGLSLVASICYWAGAADLDSQRRKFLAAETIADIGYDAEKLPLLFPFLLRDAISESPDLAAPIVVHTAKLIRQDQESNQDTYFNTFDQRQYRCHIVDYLHKLEDRQESIDVIGISVRTYRLDHSGTVPYTGIGRYSTQFAMLSHFLSLGGNYDTRAAMDQFLVDLRVACGEGEMIYLAPYFAELSSLLRPAQREAMAIWARERADHNEQSVASISAAIRLGIAIETLASGRQQPIPGIASRHALNNQFSSLLIDTELSPAWRLGFAALIARECRQHLSHQTSIACGGVVAEALSRSQMPMMHQPIAYAMAGYLRGDSTDPLWRQTGSDILASVRVTHHPTATEMARAPQSQKHWIVQMVALATRLSDEDQLNSYMQRYGTDRSLYPALWIHLVQASEFPLANQLFKQHSRNVDFSPGYFLLDSTYNQTLADKTPAYLATIADPADRAYAELAIAAVSDSSIDTHRPHPQQQRLAAYAERYGDFPELPPSLRQKALQILSLAQRQPSITRWLSEQQQGLENAIRSENPHTRAYWAGRIEMHAAIESLHEGSVFPTQMMWGRALEDTTPTIERSRGELCEAILDMVDSRIKTAIGRRGTEPLHHYLDISRQILEYAPDNLSDRELHRFLIRTLVLHAWCEDAMPSWHAWWKDLEPITQKRMVDALSRYRSLIVSIKDITHTAPSQPPLPADLSRSLLTGILSTELIDQAYPDYSTLAEATALGLLSNADLHQIAEPIARVAPRQGSSWRECLGSLADQGLAEDALEVVDALLADYTAIDFPILHTTLSVERWLLLESMGKAAEAERPEISLDISRLPREYRTVIDQIRRR